MNYDSNVSKEDGFTRKEVQWHILLLECNIIEFHQTYITFLLHDTNDRTKAIL
jgi:hypothetical protein